MNLHDLGGALVAPPVDSSEPLQYRRGTIVSVQATTPPTVTVRLAGSPTSIAGVRYPRGSSPAANDLCELIRAGSALFIVAILA